MNIEDTFLTALNHPDAIRFPTNIEEVAELQRLIPSLKMEKKADGEYWGEEGNLGAIRIKRYGTGHLVFYNRLGRRFLFSDPLGTPLHEAEWEANATSGAACLKLVRMQLDCKQWVGIKPKARSFKSQIDISGQEGWEQLTLDDLREKAAEAWRVPFSEVKYFYTDDRLTHQGDGKYNIELVKDGLYALVDGDFSKTIFVSFMFSVNWEDLDLIPVVELFQSTLPGSGGAVFEFVWGLHDDQSREKELPPLRYRGLPTYPSKGAFNIFSAFFSPEGPKGEKIFPVFMDPNRSHEIEWTARPHPPWRYFDETNEICLTVQEGHLFKVTDLKNTSAIPFVNPKRGAKPLCQRELHISTSSFKMIDIELAREIPFNALWKILPDPDLPLKSPRYPFSWKWFFNGFPPTVDPVKIYYSVPFYPEGDAEIDESALQPLALDQILYYMEMFPAMPEKLESIDKVLIHTFDMIIAGCVDCTKEREYTILYGDPELAQRNAQLLWDYAASKNQLDQLKKVSFLAEHETWEDAYKEKYGLVFKWIPQMYFQDRDTCQLMFQHTVEAVAPGGILFLAGPRPIQGLFDFFQMDCLYSDPIMNMPFFRQHLKMCPENQVNPEQAIFMLEKRDPSAPSAPPTSTSESIPGATEIEIRGFERN